MVCNLLFELVFPLAGFLAVSFVAIGILTVVIIFIGSILGYALSENKDNDNHTLSSMIFVVSLYAAIVTYFLILSNLN